ncbi:MAG: S8 family serine peptidase [Planctomycetota bacterium]
MSLRTFPFMFTFITSLSWSLVSLSAQDFRAEADGLRLEVRGDTYSLQRSDGQGEVRRGPLARHLRLRSGLLDPVAHPGYAASIPEALLSRPDTRLFLIQFRTPEISPYRRELNAAGFEILQHFHDCARLVRGDIARLSKLRALPFVRWVGPYQPYWRLDFRDRKASEVPDNWTLMTTRSGLEEKKRLLAFVRGIGGDLVRPLAPSGRLLTVRLNREQLIEVAHRDELFFAEPWGPTEADVDQARIATGADSLELVAGYSGIGVRAQVRDFGLEFNHAEFQLGPPISHVGTLGPTGHGTAVYGIVFSPGLGNSQARGLLPDAQGVFQSESSTVDRAAETAELLLPPYRCVLETNSTGSPLTTTYSAISADMDEILFDLDFLVFQSQSNSGTQDSRPEAWAKNIVSVGGVQHGDTAAFADDVWAGLTSIGPASDGRIKPDLCSFADSVFTLSPFIGYLQAFGGTSAATPIVAGAAGLVHEMWADGIFGNALASWDVFDNRPSMTLAKALLLNSARSYAFSGLAADLTRTHQGWGHPDVQRLYDDRDNMQFIDESVVLTPLGIHQQIVTVNASTPELRVTMVFADPPGNPAGTVHRVNDLSLKVTSPTGIIYHGNAGLLVGNVSTSGGSPDHIDTVERVVIASPQAGTWTIEITAEEINEDGHVETAALDADFSLVISGVQALAPAPADSGQANQIAASLKIRDAVNLNGQKPEVGTNGPFFVSRVPGESIEFSFSGAASTPFLLLIAPLNRGNFSAGAAGQLDIGLIGPSLADLNLVMNGAFPASFFDFLAVTGPQGTQRIELLMPAFPPGVLGAFQTVFYDTTGPVPVVTFSAATEVTVL